MKTMEVLARNTTLIEKTFNNLRKDLAFLKGECNKRRINILTQQNADLKVEIEFAKKKLIQIETANGKRQVSVPNRKLCTGSPVQPPEPQKSQEKIDETVQKQVKKEKIKKVQPEKKPEAEEPVHIGRLDLRVGQIMEVEKHPDADSLYVSKIQCGEPSLRTVVSGLVHFVPITHLQKRKVVVLCNLKPVKMRGILSEAMVMCASTKEAVEVLIPPENATPGDVIECEGFVRKPDTQLNPKKKIFETIAPDLKTSDSLIACYQGSALTVPGKGPIVSKSLKNVNIK